VILVLENHSLADVLDNPAAPYLNSLVSQYALATAYSGVSHPSLPNYLALTGGSTFGISSDCTSCFVSAPSIATRLDAAGRSWKAYQEAMPAPCYVGSSYPYAQKHDPFVYYDGIRQNQAHCAADVVPLSSLSQDFASSSTAPDYAFVTPDLCHDGHDCSLKSVDGWLSSFVPALLDSPGFKAARSLLVVTFDESEDASNHVLTLFVGPTVRPGFRSALPYSHYSLLRTVEEGFGLPPLADGDGEAQPMMEFFKP
jgi:phosphatidylinositol-3-phosphatase